MSKLYRTVDLKGKNTYWEVMSLVRKESDILKEN